MTEEEEKAIKDCDSIFIYLDDAMSEDSANDYRKSYKILKNIIEKQSKEIEELNKSDASKEQSSMNYYNLYKELVDKIKAKIEEYDDKGMTINLTNRSAGKTFQQAVHYEVKKILQLLLRKEFPVTITKEELEKRWKE